MANANTKNVNKNLLEEYFTANRIQIAKLNSYQKDVWNCAMDTVLMHSYYFPVNACPWDTDYFEGGEYLDLAGNRVTNEALAKQTPQIRRERMQWLMDYAYNVMDLRAVNIHGDLSTVWSQISIAILVGTYKAMCSQDMNDLCSQRYILDPNGLGIVDKFINSNKGTLLKLLRSRTADEHNRHGQISFKRKSDNRSENITTIDGKLKMYYSRVNARAMFCAKTVIFDAHQTAFALMRNRRYAHEKYRYWIEDLGHSTDLINLIIAAHKDIYKTPQLGNLVSFQLKDR